MVERVSDKDEVDGPIPSVPTFKNMIVDGIQLSQEIKNQIKNDPVLKEISQKQIVAIVVDENEEIKRFIRQKEKLASELGLVLKTLNFDKNISLEELINEVEKLNNNQDVLGIIIQLPLPPHLDSPKLFNSISVFKDIDLLSEAAFNSFYYQNNFISPPVVGAIDYIFKKYNVNIANKLAVVLGAGRLIGLPVLTWLAKNGAITLSFNDWLSTYQDVLKSADIIISGLGEPEIIKENFIKEGVILIDTGFNIKDEKICGDCDFESLKNKTSLITPVPKGIGPMTVALLFKNVLELYKISKNQ